MARYSTSLVALLLWAATASPTPLKAHPHSEATPYPSVTLTTEGLWNTTSGIANWVNLLGVDYNFNLWRNGHLTIDLLAVANLRQELGKSGVADNLHLFSAIEDSPSTLALISLGVGQHLDEGRWRLFVGIRNLGKDYFTSPWNSIFTSAENGLFPSIATNFVVADAPNSAMSLHAEWHPSPHWNITATIYDGVASDRWSDLFRLNIRRDGIFSIGQINYKGSEGSYVGNYTLGATYGYAPTATELARGRREKSSRASLWLLAEQPLWIANGSNRAIELLVHGGWAPQSDCDLYGALAVICQAPFTPSDYLGLILNRGLYKGGYETKLELTYAYTWQQLTLQPALHRVYAERGKFTIAMIKLVLAI